MVELATLSLWNSTSLVHSPKSCHPFSSLHSNFFNLTILIPKITSKSRKSSHRSSSILKILALTEGSAEKNSKDEGIVDPSIPSWANPGSDEPPPWARDEAQKGSTDFEVPFFVYLLASAVTAIAAIGSVFEYVNQNPVFGVLNSDSVFYAPLLGFFAFTGIPTSAFLWFKSVQVANKEAEDQDRKDGYL